MRTTAMCRGDLSARTTEYANSMDETERRPLFFTERLKESGDLGVKVDKWDSKI
jgi:hypothetical protein